MIFGNILFRVRPFLFRTRRDDDAWPLPAKRSNAVMGENGHAMDSVFPGIMGINMKLTKNLFILFILIFSHAISAASWYQVEAIVFDRLYPDLDGEQWQNVEFKIRDNMVELQSRDGILNSEQGLVPFMILDKKRNRMSGIYRVLRLSSEYRPLYHVSWQQPASERRQSRYVHIQRLDGEEATKIAKTEEVAEELEEPEFIEEFIMPDRIVDGSIRIRSGFYLHADVDLSYFKQLPPENKVIRSSEESFSDIQEKTVIKLKESRKIKLNEIHYFDHPMYGVILQVSRL
jgi:peptidoglycan-binding protein CsiV